MFSSQEIKERIFSGTIRGIEKLLDSQIRKLHLAYRDEDESPPRIGVCGLPPAMFMHPLT